MEHCREEAEGRVLSLRDLDDEMVLPYQIEPKKALWEVLGHDKGISLEDWQDAWCLDLLFAEP